MTDTKQTIVKSIILAPGVAQAQQMQPVTSAITAATRGKVGQPTKRTPELIDTILDRIACGESLMGVCQDTALPAYSTFNRWCREDPELLNQVDIAYEFHARTMDDVADDILAGGACSTGNFLRDKERVAHLRWRLGKLNRRRYGDKVQVDHVQHQPVIIDWNTIEGEGGDGV